MSKCDPSHFSAKLIIPGHFLTEIILHCQEQSPYEACGILAGKNNVVEKVFKMTNVEKSSVSYLMDSREQFIAMKEMSGLGLAMVAIYHSHPVSSAYPSPKDISLAFYPDTFHVIVSLASGAAVIKAFEIKDGVREIEIIETH
ncbi:MAG: M67 family metallopeptidase [Nitrospirae bacterium]|nr:M67 family metallopeptidase [Nitrospirota bacterium]